MPIAPVTSALSRVTLLNFLESSGIYNRQPEAHDNVLAQLRSVPGSDPPLAEVLD